MRAVILALLLTVVPAFAQHSHEGAAGRFYETWRKPDNPSQSCCSHMDCYATEARFRDGEWYALRREDGKWLHVPQEKIETERNNPDGRNHLCAHPPITGSNVPLCFIPGWGG